MIGSRLLNTDDRPVSFTAEAGSPSQRIEPVSLDEAKTHLRITHTEQDDMIQDVLIPSARAMFEEQTGRQAVNAVWEFALDGAPAERTIILPRPPMSPVDVSVTYLDQSGAEQSLDASAYRVLASWYTPSGSPADAFVVDPYAPCGRIEIPLGAVWPTPYYGARSLRVQRTCGYGATTASIPSVVKSVILLLIAHLYENTEAVQAGVMLPVPFGIEMMLRPFKFGSMRPQLTRQGWYGGGAY